MRLVAARRAIAATAVLWLLVIPAVHAETVTGDADTLTAGMQDTRNLGTALPGADIPVDIMFQLDCSGTSHVDAGQSIRLSLGARTIPAGGSFGVGSLTFAPGAGWPADGADCPSDLGPVTAGPLRLTLTTPSTPGDGYRYAFTFNRTLLPATAGDSVVFTGSTTVAFLVNVSDNTPPVVHVPGDTLVEATGPAGAAVTFSATAEDLEDAVAPVPDCSPASGSTFPLGSTVVSCSATDDGGLSDSADFTVTVRDTTAPVMPNVADVHLTTGDPAGAVFDWGFSFVEAVDPAPTRACTTEPGSVFPVGTTRVTCTARDFSGNTSSMSFDVTVTYVPPVTWSATWGEPVGSSGGTFVANPGRNLPVKVAIFANGVAQTRGTATLTIATCGGSVVGSTSMSWGGGRWNGALDTGALGGAGCYTVTARLDGNSAGSFRIDLRGADPASANGPKGKPKG